MSLAVVLARNPVRSTLLLILSFLPASLLYLLLQAPFVAILQILVYGGAIMMLFTFVIMMINPAPKEGEVPGGKPSGAPVPIVRLRAVLRLLLPAAAALAFIPPVYRAAAAIPPAPVEKSGFGSLASMAELMFRNPGENPLTVSFELISFLILAGIVAAVNFNRRRTEPPLRERQPEGGA